MRPRSISRTDIGLLSILYMIRCSTRRKGANQLFSRLVFVSRLSPTDHTLLVPWFFPTDSSLGLFRLLGRFLRCLCLFRGSRAKGRRRGTCPRNASRRPIYFFYSLSFPIARSLSLPFTLYLSIKRKDIPGQTSR